jgi:hypothetical protein
MQRTYLSREETIEFTDRIRRQCTRRGWSIKQGLAAFGVRRTTFDAWSTVSAWGCRISYEEAFRIAAPWGIKIPKARRVTSHFVWPDGDFEEWVDLQLTQIGTSRAGVSSDAGLITSVMGALFSRWANLGLSPKLVLDSGHDGRVVRSRLQTSGVSAAMNYAMDLELEKGEVFGMLYRIPTSTKAAAAVGKVGAIYARGASFLIIERRLKTLRDRTTKRKRNSAMKPAETFAALEQSIMELCRVKQAPR